MSWGHKRVTVWTNLCVKKLFEIPAENPCAHTCDRHRTSPRRRKAHPVRRATRGHTRRATNGWFRWVTTGRDRTTGNRMFCLTGRRSCVDLASARSGSTSVEPSAHLRVNARRPLPCLVGGAFCVRRQVWARPVRRAGSDTARGSSESGHGSHPRETLTSNGANVGTRARRVDVRRNHTDRMRRRPGRRTPGPGSSWQHQLASSS